MASSVIEVYELQAWPYIFSTVSEDLALGHLLKVMSVSVPVQLLFHLCKAKCRQTAFSFLHLHKMPCSLFSSGLSGALCCCHYRIIFLSEIICIMGPGAITSIIQGVTHCNRSWSCRTGLTQPHGLWLQRWTCTDGGAGNKCCPGQGWDERLSLKLWVLF